MLTPSQLLAVASDVAERWRATADALTETMAGYLVESDALSQDIQGAVRTANGLPQRILSRLASLSPATESMVRRAVVAALSASARSDAAAVSGALAALSEADQRAIGNSAEAVVSQIMSLARRGNLSMAEDARRTYVGVVSRLVPQVQRGTMSSERAVMEAVREMAERGVCVVDYASGRREQPDVAIRRHVQTQVGQAAATRTMEACERLGVELVEVSSHTGARKSHREWQGRVFSLHGTVEVGGVTYRDLREATGYGDPGGLCGVNCRHSFAPYVPGRPRRWGETPDKDEGLDPEEHYRATQRQRAIERKIREAKREAAADRAAGVDDTDARLRLGRAQAEMRQLLKDSGGTLDRQPARERAFDADGRPVSARGLSRDPREFEVGRSLGAAAHRDDVRLPDGSHAKLTEGTRVTGVRVIAGAGSERKIDDVDRLVRTYGGKREDWSKRRGTGQVDDLGLSRRCELHWYQCEEAGRVEMKVKRFYY